jgi:hypothetical protein
LAKEVAQRLLANLSHAFGAQCQYSIRAVNEALLAQALGGSTQRFDVTGGVIAEITTQSVDIYFIQALSKIPSVKESFEISQVAQLLHRRSSVAKTAALLTAQAIGPLPIGVG